MGNNIVAFIPIRSGSKSIPDKNIKEIGGKPLVAWTIETSLKAGLRTIVNSDSEKYLEIASRYGAETMLRPKDLAEDFTPMFEVLRSEIFKIKPVPEIVVLLSATVPFRKLIILQNAISYFIASMDKYDSAMAVQKIPQEYNPAQVIINTSMGLRMADGRELWERATSRQSYPEAFVTSQGIYIFKTSNLSRGNFYGDKTMLLECNSSIDINTKEDFQKAELELLSSKTNENNS